MERIEPVKYSHVSSEVKEAFDLQINKHGRITNMKRTLLHSLPAFNALMEWYKLRDALLAFLTAREVDLFSYAISEQNKCLICSTFFRKILIDSKDNPDAPKLSQREDLLIRYGKQCVVDPNNLDDHLFAELKRLFTDYEIVTLTAFAGLMIATNLINNALKVELDEYLIQYTKR